MLSSSEQLLGRTSMASRHTPDDEPSLLWALLLGTSIVVLLVWVCHAPGSAPPTQRRERPHSFSSTQKMVETQVCADHASQREAHLHMHNTCVLCRNVPRSKGVLLTKRTCTHTYAHATGRSQRRITPRATPRATEND
jgi:hypothetical protein